MRDLQKVQKCSDVDQIEAMTRRIFDYIDNDKNGCIEGSEIIDFMKIMHRDMVDSFKSLYSHMSEIEKKKLIKKNTLELDLKAVAFVEEIDSD